MKGISRTSVSNETALPLSAEEQMVRQRGLGRGFQAPEPRRGFQGADTGSAHSPSSGDSPLGFPHERLANPKGEPEGLLCLEIS